MLCCTLNCAVGMPMQGEQGVRGRPRGVDGAADGCRLEGELGDGCRWGPTGVPPSHPRGVPPTVLCGCSVTYSPLLANLSAHRCVPPLLPPTVLPPKCPTGSCRIDCKLFTPRLSHSLLQASPVSYVALCCSAACRRVRLQRPARSVPAKGGAAGGGRRRCKALGVCCSSSRPLVGVVNRDEQR